MCVTEYTPAGPESDQSVTREVSTLKACTCCGVVVSSYARAHGAFRQVLFEEYAFRHLDHFLHCVVHLHYLLDDFLLGPVDIGYLGKLD